jgi:hypothetical protein
MRSRNMIRAMMACVAFASAVPFGFAAGYTLPAAVTVSGQDQVSDTGLSFLPFGWSAKGSFAWLSARFVDGRGGTEYTFVVYDAVQDIVTWKLTDDSFQWPDGTEDSPTVAWTRNKAAVTRALTDAGIVQAKSIPVVAFPLSVPADRYTADLAPSLTPDTEEADSNHVQGYTLTLTSRVRGSKVVTQQSGLTAMNAVVEGCIPSPWEPRILVVVGEVKRAFEGAEVDLRFYGAHLALGFRK